METPTKPRDSLSLAGRAVGFPNPSPHQNFRPALKFRDNSTTSPTSTNSPPDSQSISRDGQDFVSDPPYDAQFQQNQVRIPRFPASNLPESCPVPVPRGQTTVLGLCAGSGRENVLQDAASLGRNFAALSGGLDSRKTGTPTRVSWLELMWANCSPLAVVPLVAS